MGLQNNSNGVFNNNMMIYSASKIARQQTVVTPASFAVQGLPEEDLNKILFRYSNNVEDILPLTESQEWLFSNDTIVSAGFYIQALFKVGGFIEPQELIDHIDKLVREDPILRTVIYYRDIATPLQVVLKTRSAEIRFHDLSNLTVDKVNETLENIMIADRRRGFDLENDRLLRIGVFHTRSKEYAVLIAQPQLIADGWDFGLIFVNMFKNQETTTLKAKMLNAKDFSFSKYLEKRGEQDKKPAIKYWEKLLTKLPINIKLPGYKHSDLPYSQAVSIMNVDRKLDEAIKQVAQNNATIVVLLQTAWGIMLQRYNRTNDVVFGVVLSNRSASMQNIEDVASIVNVMLIRVTCPINISVEELIKKQQLQLMVSQPYSFCSLDELQELSKIDKPLFNHFLNFHSFAISERYTEVETTFGVTPVAVNSFDYCNTDLGIYFRMTAHGLSMEFVYNKTSFTEKQIALLQQGYLAVLRQIVQNPSIAVYELKMPSIEQVLAADVDSRTEQQERINFFETIDVFAKLPKNIIAEIANSAASEYYVEGDVILSEGMKQERLLIVFSGQVEVSRKANNGWSSNLEILQPGQIISFESIFDNRESSIHAEVVKGDVTIISLKNSEICKLIHKYFIFSTSVIMHLNEQINKFQKILVSAE
ncbi:MAG: amino acid adenylation protein [Firmicutes bacterium]|nr:amino acid adenylation protein [Bacillota bacterium]